MVELELLERGEGPVAGLEQLEAAPFGLVELVKAIGLGFRLLEKGQRNGNDANDGDERSQHQRDRQRVAGTPISLVRATSFRCSRASGQSAIADPRTNTKPAIQMRFTSGLTKTRKYTLPSESI